MNSGSYDVFVDSKSRQVALALLVGPRRPLEILDDEKLQEAAKLQKCSNRCKLVASLQHTCNQYRDIFIAYRSSPCCVLA